MYKTLIWCSSAMVAVAALVVIVAVASASQEHGAVTNMQPQTPVSVITPTEVPLQPEVPSEEELKVAQLASYVLDAMNNAAKPDSYSASYEDISNDIAAVVMDPKEPPMWKEDSTKARTEIMLTGIAFWETRFRAYVDDGRCNDKEWRASPEGQSTMQKFGTCDGGIARSLWQIHAEKAGITVFPVNYDDESQETNKHEWCYASAPECDDDGGQVITPQDLITDRKNAIRVALHMARHSIRNNAHLCQFTGEGGLGADGCPKGEIRFDWANTYSAKHPFSFVKLVEE